MLEEDARKEGREEAREVENYRAGSQLKQVFTCSRHSRHRWAGPRPSYLKIKKNISQAA